MPSPGRERSRWRSSTSWSQRRGEGHSAPLAYVYAGLGEHDQAIEWLERAREKRDDALTYLAVLSCFDPLRSDPRFQDLLRRMNFPN